FDSIAGTSSATELPSRPDCPVCAQIKAPVRISHGRAEFAEALRRGRNAEIRFSEPLILSTDCKSCGVARGKDTPLLWRAADHDSRLADCPSCGAAGSVEVSIRDKISREALATGGADLPLRFAMMPSDQGTEVFVLEQET